jgi:hypothetical protein
MLGGNDYRRVTQENMRSIDAGVEGTLLIFMKDFLAADARGQIGHTNLPSVIGSRRKNDSNPTIAYCKIVSVGRLPYHKCQGELVTFVRIRY